ncbi:Fcf2 pre-rRNA processing-domain-containing protein [Lipomyces japonicus]|uniref:Fcf2 pre-rRNA processing-domain-containing protein n=1 Tax=Lipomyces japonicus TaxID=56871 RepID=UPI0034CDD015
MASKKLNPHRTDVESEEFSEFGSPISDGHVEENEHPEGFLSLRHPQEGIRAEDDDSFIKSLPRLDPGLDLSKLLSKKSGVIQLNYKAIAGNEDVSKLHFRNIVDKVQEKKEKIAVKEATAGDKWFNLPKTEITPTIKRDLQLLKMRGVLDPKRHYRKENDKELPKYFQTGTIVEGPTEFFSSRLTKKERKQTLADEILADQKSKEYFKRRYDEIQTVKTSGGKNHYKGVKQKRVRR